MGTRICAHCKTSKPLSEFNKLKKKGYSKNCIACLEKVGAKRAEAVRVDAANLKLVKESLLAKGEKILKIAPLVYLEYSNELRALALDGFLDLKESWDDGLVWTVELLEEGCQC